ncbi:MAG: type II toxin-antitoxin system VapC family toxin [Patescibacteria group bacterium]
MTDYYKKLYIVDASVIIKWGALEENHKEALKLREDFLKNNIEFAIPTLAIYEAMNYMVRKEPNKALLFLSQLLSMKINQFSITLGNTAKSLDITEAFKKTSFYDAHYHSLAILNNATFITADEKYYEQAKSLKHIQLLKHYF